MEGAAPVISEGRAFIIRHSSGRYFNSLLHFDTDAAGCHIPGTMALFFRLVEDPRRADTVYSREHCGRFLETAGWRGVGDQFTVVPAPCCACCGEHDGLFLIPGPTNVLVWRCRKHRERNPCAIDGCQRTSAADGHHGDDQWLCSEHWRRFCPPRSLRRRAYRAFFRKAKRYGWSDELRAQFWRFWDTLVRNARAKAEGGSLNLAEIERLFGV